LVQYPGQQFKAIEGSRTAFTTTSLEFNKRSDNDEDKLLIASKSVTTY
jgi:hypothetical protein